MNHTRNMHYTHNVRMIKTRRMTCSTNGGEEECIYDFGGKARERDF
jgi:hypothetical protein